MKMLRYLAVFTMHGNTQVVMPLKEGVCICMLTPGDTSAEKGSETLVQTIT